MKISLVLLLMLLFFEANAQSKVVKSNLFASKVPLDIQANLLKALDTLLHHIDNDKILSSEIDTLGMPISISILGSLKGIGINKISGMAPLYYYPKLINIHLVRGNQYSISIAYIGDNTLKAIMTFYCRINADKVRFAIPLFYLTKDWKIKKVGGITYHYADKINLIRAKKFDNENNSIAKKFGLEPEKFDFYLVRDYQDIMNLFGYSFDSEMAGHESDGYGVSDGYIFSIMHNEDFSHDTFHYYAEKVRTHARNGAAEEGAAYSWGNAYYTDDNGEMISQRRLVEVLKQYLQQYPKTNLLELFSTNPNIFPYKTQVRSLLASLINDEVERKKGIAGIKALIDCGMGDDNYFKMTNQLIGINYTDFNIEVEKLLEEYK